MNRKCVSLILFAAAAGFTAKLLAADSLDEGGWRILRPLETPAKTTSESGSQDPIPVFALHQPGITEPNHLIAGEIRFAKVEGTGYLEMWTIYPDGSRYFSRTLADSGPMGKLMGDSDWTQVTLPFFGKEGQAPVRLEVNAVLPGGGDIEWRNLALYQRPGDAGQPWWTDRAASLIGSFGGLVFGLLGAVGGILGGMGKARGLVMSILTGAIILGAVALVIGIAALVNGQPYSVWYPPVLFGGIAALVGGISFPVVRRAYIQRELRLIAAAG